MGIGCDDPATDLSINGGVYIGEENIDPGNGNLHVGGNLNVDGNVVLSGGEEGTGGLEVNGPITSGSDELVLKDSVRIIADTGKGESDGNLSVQGDTVLGTYHSDSAQRNVVTVNGSIRSGADTDAGEEQYELEINDILTVNREAGAASVSVDSPLIVAGSSTLGNNQGDDCIYLNGTVQRNGDSDVTIDDDMTVTGSASLGTSNSDAIGLNGIVSSNSGEVKVDDDFSVTGSTRLGDAKTDRIVMNGTVSSDREEVRIEDDLKVSGSVEMGASQSNYIRLNGTLSSNKGDVKIDDNLVVTGTTTLGTSYSDGINLNGTVKSGLGAVKISDSVDINGNLNITGSLKFDGNNPGVSRIVSVVNNYDDTAVPTEKAVLKCVKDNTTSFFNQVEYKYTDPATSVTGSGSWGRGHTSYVNIYPPSGYSMSKLVYFSVSPRFVPFAGGVDGNDTFACWAERKSSYVRCYVGNSEQRGRSCVAFYALWKR